ncbi:hypothetical protein ACFE04_014214 [Oxalis oulophora]
MTFCLSAIPNIHAIAPARASYCSIAGGGCSVIGYRCRCSPIFVNQISINQPRKSSSSSHVVRMAPDEEKLTQRNPLDFPVEWERPKPGRRPDIFPKFSPMKTPLPPPLPADPPEEDEEEDDEEKKKKEEEEEGEDEEEKEDESDKPDKESTEADSIDVFVLLIGALEMNFGLFFLLSAGSKSHALLGRSLVEVTGPSRRLSIKLTKQLQSLEIIGHLIYKKNQKKKERSLGPSMIRSLMRLTTTFARAPAASVSTLLYYSEHLPQDMGLERLVRHDMLDSEHYLFNFLINFLKTFS